MLPSHIHTFFMWIIVFNVYNVWWLLIEIYEEALWHSIKWTNKIGVDLN